MVATKDKDQAFRRKLVIRVGELIHGKRWIAPLAADLSAATGRRIAGPQISHWLSETKPFPEYVENGLLQVMNTRIAAILAEGSELRTEAMFLELRLATRLNAKPPPLPTAPLHPLASPEPDPEPDNAPSMGGM